MKRLVSIFSVFAFLTIGLFGFSADAYAATPGEHLTGTDPEATGCAADAQTVSTTYIKNYMEWTSMPIGTNLAKVELRYSPTCRTAWGRITKLHSGVNQMFVFVERDAPSYWESPTKSSTGNSTYSQQVNDAGYLARARGYTQIDNQ